MEEAQAKTNDIRDTIKAEILVREVEGLTAGTYIIHWASVLSNHFDITGFKKVYGDLYKAFYRLPSKLFNFTPLTKYRYFVIPILRYANAFVHIIRSLVFRKRYICNRLLLLKEYLQANAEPKYSIKCRA